MAGFVRYKIGMGMVGAIIHIAVALLVNNFFAPTTIKRWGPLSWNDFQGVARPFSSYDASISSNIYLEYDSANKQYRAYAGQHSSWSWVRSSDDNREYLLNHEQYHFNITKVFARELNRYIDETRERASEHLYALRLSSLRIDVAEMQNKYDADTGHGLRVDRQRRWEVQD